MKEVIAVFLFILSFFRSSAQKQTDNVIIITLDGFRWQEVFGGADDSLISDKRFSDDTAALKKKYWATAPEERRKKLMPFLWSTVAQQGQIHGNRSVGSLVNVQNRYWFSYPGYNEIFTGYPDTLVNSNDKNENKNVTVLEYLNKQPSLKGRIAAFTSWDVFDAIINEKRSGIPVSSGFDDVKLATPQMTLLNEMQRNSFQPFGDGVRPDMLTYYMAKEYLKAQKPRVLYIAFDETDDYAHGGKYDFYLNSANLNDRYIADLWTTVQTMPEYKDKTTFIITCDHGRGDAVKKEWTSHGEKIVGADQIWMAFLGKGIASKGEVKQSEQLYQSQLAQTIASLLGYWFNAGRQPIANGITTLSR